MVSYKMQADIGLLTHPAFYSGQHISCPWVIYFAVPVCRARSPDLFQTPQADQSCLHLSLATAKAIFDDSLGHADADTLRKSSPRAALSEAGAESSSSPEPPQEAFYPNRALADVYGGTLTSSKSEPHGKLLNSSLMPVDLARLRTIGD